MKVGDPEVVSIRELARRLLALEGDPAFQGLQAGQERTNLFQIVGTTERERWHSAFWAWVLDPDGSHRLGDFGIKRLLVRCATEDGTIRAVPLQREASESAEWVNWTASNCDHQVLGLREVMSFKVEASIVAPGPRSGYSEVTSRLISVDSSKGRSHSGDDNRFDILIVARGTLARGDSHEELLLFVVAEMKVNAPYKAEQLGRYSQWVHVDPSGSHLKEPTGAVGFRHSFEKLVKQHIEQDRRAQCFGIGIFIDPWNKFRTETPPDRLVPPWSAVTFGDLVEDILEPALKNPDLEENAALLIRTYLDLVADPQMEVLNMPLDEHKKLVDELLDRHPETFRIIAKVLEGSTDGGTKEVGDTISVSLADRQASNRAASLTPADLLDKGMAELGNRLEHIPITVRKLGRKPFEGRLVAKLASGNRSGFQLVEGPEGVELGDELFASTALLKEVYRHFNASYSASGNTGLRFIDGPSEGMTLDEAYSQLRDG